MNSKKKILKPSIIHGDFTGIKNSSHLVEKNTEDDVQPENPERNYHHDAIRDLSTSDDEVEHRDELGRDDGEDQSNNLI